MIQYVWTYIITEMFLNLKSPLCVYTFQVFLIITYLECVIFMGNKLNFGYFYAG